MHINWYLSAEPAQPSTFNSLNFVAKPRLLLFVAGLFLLLTGHIFVEELCNVLQPTSRTIQEQPTSHVSNGLPQADLTRLLVTATSEDAVTDIVIVQCAISALWRSECVPSAALEVAVSPWIKLKRETSLSVGIWHTYIFFRKDPVRSPITDIRVLSSSNEQDESVRTRLASEGWTRALSETSRWRKPDYDLWFKKETNTTAVTDLQVVYGSSGSRQGWHEAGILSYARKKAVVKLLFQTGHPTLTSRPVLRFRNGNFRILQIADLHFSTGEGHCRGVSDPHKCSTSPEEADKATMRWLNPLVDEVSPDLIVLSGDQLNGQMSSWDALSVLYKVNSLFAERQIPWTAIFGNHDSEATSLSRREQMKVMQQFSFFLGSPGPLDVDGASNYQLPIYAPQVSDDPVFSLYFLDSHTHHKKAFFWSYYDWLTQSQTDWFKSVSNTVRPILRPIRGTRSVYDEVSNGWRSSKRSSRQTLKKPNAIAFSHIPLPEAYLKPDLSVDGQPLSVGTTKYEGYSAPKHNSGFFEQALLYQTERGPMDQMETDERLLPEVKVIAHGHCHNRDSCERIRGVWMCFSGGSSYAGYGRPDFNRRARVFDLSDWGETISTNKFLDEVDRESGRYVRIDSVTLARGNGSGIT